MARLKSRLSALHKLRLSRTIAVVPRGVQNMDWNKLGAIGSIGSFILAAGVLVKQLLAGVPLSDAGRSKVLLILLVAGFLCGTIAILLSRKNSNESQQPVGLSANGSFNPTQIQNASPVAEAKIELHQHKHYHPPTPAPSHTTEATSNLSLSKENYYVQWQIGGVWVQTTSQRNWELF
jgi:hypothetical protein